MQARVPEHPFTKRGVLATLNSTFDPLIFCAHSFSPDDGYNVCSYLQRLTIRIFQPWTGMIHFQQICDHSGKSGKTVYGILINPFEFQGAFTLRTSMPSQIRLFMYFPTLLLLQRVLSCTYVPPLIQEKYM